MSYAWLFSFPFRFCWLMLGQFLSSEKRGHMFFTAMSPLPFWGWNNKGVFSHAGECLTSGVRLRFEEVAKCVTRFPCAIYAIFSLWMTYSFVVAAVCFSSERLQWFWSCSPVALDILHVTFLICISHPLLNTFWLPVLYLSLHPALGVEYVIHRRRVTLEVWHSWSLLFPALNLRLLKSVWFPKPGWADSFPLLISFKCMCVPLALSWHAILVCLFIHDVLSSSLRYPAAFPFHIR